MNVFAIVGAVLITGWALNCGAQPADDDPRFITALTDVVAGQACERLEGQFRGLESDDRNSKPVFTGTLWIKECRAGSVDGEPHKLTLSINAEGWRWIYRKKEKLAAEFVVSDYGKFDVAVDVTGRLDAVYDPRAKVMALWFLPQGEPRVRFSHVSDIDVDEEGLWASVLGGVASVFMHSPEDLATETFQQLGRKKLTQKLAEGFSVATDFCTGRTFTQLAKLSKEQLISSVEQKAIVPTRRVQIHPDGLVIVGPLSAKSEKLQVKINGTSANQLRAQLICQDSAERLARAFINNELLPDVQVLATNEGGSLLTVDAAPGNCPIALITRPSGQTERPFNFSYRVTEQRVMEPLADCD